VATPRVIAYPGYLTIPIWITTPAPYRDTGCALLQTSTTIGYVVADVSNFTTSIAGTTASAVAIAWKMV
jgi:hypothetical protein